MLLDLLGGALVGLAQDLLGASLGLGNDAITFRIDAPRLLDLLGQRDTDLVEDVQTLLLVDHGPRAKEPA